MDCCGIFPYHNQHEQIIIHSRCHSLFSMHKCYSPTGRQLPLPYSARHTAHCRDACPVRNGALLGPIQLCRHHTHAPSRNDRTRICQLHRPVARVAPSTATLGIKALADHLYNIKTGKKDDSKTPELIRDYFATLTEKYLGDSESPLHNDLLYTQFLDIMAANKFASMAERTRNEYMARNLKKNLPGTTATDFVYIDRKNQQHRLYNLKAKYTLLYFYDPDCDHCHETAAQIAAMPETSSPAISVLAIYPYSDSDMWKTKKSRMPATWTEGYSPDGQITTDDIYYIKSVPSVYLLDEQKRVVLKNPSITLLQNTLRKLTATAAK